MGDTNMRLRIFRRGGGRYPEDEMFAKSKNESRTTVSSRKQRVLEKLRLFFEDRGFDVHK